MSCSPNDLKDFLVGELSEAERARVGAHVAACRACSDELERLRMTHAALHALRDEDPPRRIAFVSDKVFEPGWWQRLWASGPRLAFASAAMLSIALVFNAAYRPAAAPARPAPVAATIDTAALNTRVETEVTKRLQPAIEAAVARSEGRQARRASELVEAVRSDLEFQRAADRAAFDETLTVIQKKLNSMRLEVASASFGARQ
jgi:anti-sigma factor RsiW